MESAAVTPALSVRTDSLDSGNSNNTCSNNKIRVGLPTYLEFSSTKDLFTIQSLKVQMEKKERAKKIQNDYIAKILKDGDIHYFRQQNFNAAYQRTNSKGQYTPQGAFDVDPEGFINKNFNVDDFEYKGLHFIIPKKGAKEDYYHKILVKSNVLYPILQDLIAKDECFTPESGQVLTYTKFYSTFICGTKSQRKSASKLEREKMSIARKNNDEQIEGMEKQEIAILDKGFGSDIAKVKLEQDELKKKMSDSSIDVNDYDRLNLLKVMIDSKEMDLEKKIRLNKNRIHTYYNEIKELRNRVLVARAAIQIKKNQKRRVKRSIDKSKRMKADNGLVEETVPNGETTIEKMSDSNDEDSYNDEEAEEFDDYM